MPQVSAATTDVSRMLRDDLGDTLSGGVQNRSDAQLWANDPLTLDMEVQYGATTFLTEAPGPSQAFSYGMLRGFSSAQLPRSDGGAAAAAAQADVEGGGSRAWQRGSATAVPGPSPPPQGMVPTPAGEGPGEGAQPQAPGGRPAGAAPPQEEQSPAPPAEEDEDMVATAEQHHEQREQQPAAVPPRVEALASCGLGPWQSVPGSMQQHPPMFPPPPPGFYASRPGMPPPPFFYGAPGMLPPGMLPPFFGPPPPGFPQHMGGGMGGGMHHVTIQRRSSDGTPPPDPGPFAAAAAPGADPSKPVGKRQAPGDAAIDAMFAAAAAAAGQAGATLPSDVSEVDEVLNNHLGATTGGCRMAPPGADPLLRYGRQSSDESCHEAMNAAELRAVPLLGASGPGSPPQPLWPPMGVLPPGLPHCGDGCGGGGGGGLSRTTRAARAACLMRYREKKARRGFGAKRIRYQMRKINADKRPRVKGRFVKAAEAESLNNRAADELQTDEGAQD